MARGRRKRRRQSRERDGGSVSGAVTRRGREARSDRGSHGEQTSLRTWFSSLSVGVKWLVGAVIAAGAVAAAIGSIIALWPKPTPELRAEITKLAIDQNVTLSDYRARNERASTLAPDGRTELILAADFAAPTTTAPTTTAPTTTVPTTTAPTTTAPTTTAPTTTIPTTTGGTTTTRDGKVLPVLDDQARVRLDEGVQRALGQSPAAIPIIIGPACSSNPSGPDCGLGSTAVYLQVFDEHGSPARVESSVVAGRLAKLLTASRMQPTAGGNVPVGVTVNYDISLTGFRGRRVIVRWSLYSVPNGKPVPEGWLRDEPVHWLRGEANKDSASDSFWVPLPKIGGPFYIRVGVFDDDDVRLDFENSSSFQ
jgi:hypothetical protein